MGGFCWLVELQRLGVDCSSHRGVARNVLAFVKALGGTPRTLRAFPSRSGLLRKASTRACGSLAVVTGNFENGVETGAHDLNWDGLPYGFLALPQYDTERILEACLNRYGGSVYRGLTLTEFAESGDRVIARVRDLSRQRFT